MACCFSFTCHMQSTESAYRVHRHHRCSETLTLPLAIVPSPDQLQKANTNSSSNTTFTTTPSKKTTTQLLNRPSTIRDGISSRVGPAGNRCAHYLTRAQRSTRGPPRDVKKDNCQAAMLYRGAHCHCLATWHALHTGRDPVSKF